MLSDHISATMTYTRQFAEASFVVRYVGNLTEVKSFMFNEIPSMAFLVTSAFCSKNFL